MGFEAGEFSVPINISTNAWNIIKFMAMYIFLDTAVPILLECIDKAAILHRFSRDGRVPISYFTRDRHARSGVREIVTHTLRRCRKRPFLKRSQSALRLRPILLFSMWAASIIGEYGSGSGPRVASDEIPQLSAPIESIMQAMFTCVEVEGKENKTILDLSVRNATMTGEGLTCSCGDPNEVGCTMPTQVQRIKAIVGSPLRAMKPVDPSKLTPGQDFPLFSSSGRVNVEKYREYSSPSPYNQNESNGADYIDYVMVQGRAEQCDMCSYLPTDIGPVDDIQYRIYGTQDREGKLTSFPMFTANLSKGTLMGLAFAKKKVFQEQDTLDDHFAVNYASMISFLPNVWEAPGWQNRSFVRHHLALFLTGAAVKTFEGENSLGLERQPDFSAIWSAWLLLGHVNNSPNGTVTFNASSRETATISLLGILSFSYVIIVFFVLLIYTVVSRNWGQALKTNGFGNVEWLISSLIAQQQPQGASLRGVDDFEQFDLTIVSNKRDVYHVRSHHWLTSVPLASSTSNLNVIDGKTDPDALCEHIP